MKQVPEPNTKTEILLYNTPDGRVKVEIYLQNETVWLSQQKIAELFGVQRPAVTKHLKNIFEAGELEEQAVSSILEHTASDRKTYKGVIRKTDVSIAKNWESDSSNSQGICRS